MADGIDVMETQALSAVSIRGKCVGGNEHPETPDVYEERWL